MSKNIGIIIWAIVLLGGAVPAKLDEIVSALSTKSVSKVSSLRMLEGLLVHIKKH